MANDKAKLSANSIDHGIYIKAQPEVNMDELVGYVMRNTADKTLYYEDVKAVLDAEVEFLKSKGLAQ